MIEFTIDGIAVPAGRPKFSTLGGHARAVDPKKSRDYKSYVSMIASLHKPREPLTGPLELQIKVYRTMPKGFSKKKATEAECELIMPVTKPDTSNYTKLIEDACNGILWRDDSQIVDLIVKKRYSFNRRVEVKVREL